jgi:hypothetical protein
MKIKFLILLILTCFNLHAQPAWEQPLDQQKWHWVTIGANKAALNELVLTDLTKKEQINTYTFILPIAKWDSKNNKWLSATEWFRGDCNTKKSESLGIYTNGVFSLASNPAVSPPNSIGDGLVRMICGTETEDKSLILGIFGSLAGESFVYHGIIPQEIKLNASNPSAIDLKLYQYDVYSGQKGFSFKYTLDCKKQTVFWHNDPNKISDITSDALEVRAYKYLSKISCDYAEKKLWAQNTKVEAPRDLSKAKEKCIALGFKTGTEKFGTCVLELTK